MESNDAKQQPGSSTTVAAERGKSATLPSAPPPRLPTVSAKKLAKLAARETRKRPPRFNFPGYAAQRNGAGALGAALGGGADNGLLRMATNLVSNKLFSSFDFHRCFLLLLLLCVSTPLLAWSASVLGVALTMVIQLALGGAMMWHFDRSLLWPSSSSPSDSHSASAGVGAAAASSGSSPRYNPKYVPRFATFLTQMCAHCWWLGIFLPHVDLARGWRDVLLFTTALVWTFWAHNNLQASADARPSPHKTRTNARAHAQQQQQQQQQHSLQSSTSSTPWSRLQQLMPLVGAAEVALAVGATLHALATITITQAQAPGPAAAAGVGLINMRLLCVTLPADLLLLLNLMALYYNWRSMQTARHVAVISGVLCAHGALLTLALTSERISEALARLGARSASMFLLPPAALLMLCLNSLVRDKLHTNKAYALTSSASAQSAFTAEVAFGILTIGAVSFIFYYSTHALWYILLQYLLLQLTAKEYFSGVQNSSPMELIGRFMQMN